MLDPDRRTPADPDHFDRDAAIDSALIAAFLVVGLLSALYIFETATRAGLI